ncbi:hypothetical protein GCM10010326_56700 [Streptomyces xanthochromogenes]|uniref:Uncharacterized protein n=1 Tax=Streptomyces xanthochromogenes TaxID=67384 RepID=A0ABQ3ALS3_9ACTN|nr:hypothetical protein GCM10010326_56700 [Streptomyces xanthochromogenes]
MRRACETGMPGGHDRGRVPDAAWRGTQQRLLRRELNAGAPVPVLEGVPAPPSPTPKGLP